jgi:hypothetical protein
LSASIRRLSTSCAMRRAVTHPPPVAAAGGFNMLWCTRAALQLLGAGYALSLCLRLQVSACRPHIDPEGGGELAV